MALHTTVEKFMSHSSRPYSINDIIVNLGTQINKSALQKTIDQLVADGTLMEKCYNKQKIYCSVQKPSSDDAIEGIEAKTREKEAIYNKLYRELKDVQHELTALQKCETVAEIKLNNDQLQEKIEILKLKLMNLEKQDPNNHVNGDEIKKMEKTRCDVLKEGRKRKRLLNEFISTVLESYPKTKKHLMDDIGIEEVDNFPT